jgi:hypothetical protein
VPDIRILIALYFEIPPIGQSSSCSLSEAFAAVLKTNCGELENEMISSKHDFIVALGTSSLLIPLTAIMTLMVLQRWVGKLGNKQFRPVYRKRECTLDDIDMKYHRALEPHLEQVGLKLLENAGFEQIATPVEGYDRFDALSAIDGRRVQFLLVGSQKRNPLAVIHIGGDGSPVRLPAGMSDSFGFASALFESIGIPEIVVYDRDMKDPARVVERFQEIVRDGTAGIVRV